MICLFFTIPAFLFKKEYLSFFIHTSYQYLSQNRTTKNLPTLISSSKLRGLTSGAYDSGFTGTNFCWKKKKKKKRILKKYFHFKKIEYTLKISHEKDALKQMK